ncbi:Hypothetical Protein FCC1311_063042 [Hondaea fermentalgiana]|uniref:Uncharacterized protein n=1 Tax=Hondaea fermentalgiana TaxID=2315210 RepID=A0A2R5GQC8_9STRA|nr:Hypothetical Protein FCC1311_063042 [Hondaea fermentalgiana]|eukprot:GBG30084.1 Hypothetical Protein FCC1311_063042 [Hondaea fermentalgiana]
MSMCSQLQLQTAVLYCSRSEHGATPRNLFKRSPSRQSGTAMMAEGDDDLDPWGSGSLEEGDESEYGRQVPPAAVTPPPSIHRGGRFATRSQEDDHELDNDDDEDEDDDEDDYHRHGTVHGSGGGDSRSQGTASTLAPEDVELLSEHLATVKLKAEERVFSLNSQLRDLRRKLAASEKKNMEMHHKLYLQSPQLAPHRLDFGEEEEMLNEGSDNGVNVDRDGNESDGSNTMSNGTPTASSDDPILIAWEQGNRDFAEGNFEGGVRHYTIAARMLAANHAAAETRVSELESELEEIDAERTLFASRDMASRDELDQAHQERDRAQEERDEALAAVQELREHHESALQDIVRLQNQVEGEQTRAATAVEELEARVKSLQEELDQVYASNSETEARMRADLSEQLTNARNAALQEIEPELETLREKLRAQENEAQEASQQRNELEAQLADAGHLRTQIEELQSNLRSAEDRCNSLAQDLESKDTQNNQLEAEIARLRETLEQETARISNNQSREEDLTQLRIQLEDAQNLEADARSQISLLEDQERDLYTRVEELEAENKELEGKFSEKTGQLKQLLRKTKARKEAMEKQSQQIALLEAERDEADAKIKAVEENLRAAQDDNHHHVSALQDARMEIESMEARAASLETRLQAAEAALQEAQQHVSTQDETGHRAESELAAMQSSHDRKIGDLQAKIEEGRSACLAEEVRANDAERRATESATKLEEAHKDVERLRIAESSLHDRIQHLESELAKVTNERDDLDECLQQKQDDILELEERIAEALQREAALRQGKETKIDQVQPHASSDPFISPVKARDDGAQHDFWQGTSPNQDDGFASPAQGLTSPPTADLNWDSLVTGQGDTGDFAFGEASPSRQDEAQTRVGGSLQDDQLVADLQWRADDADKRAKQLLAELETARSLSENLQEEVARAQASYEETKGDLDVALEQLELERDRNEVLRSQVSDTQQARDQSEAMQHSAFATPGKPVAPQSDEEAVGDVSALFGNSPNEKDFMLDEKSAIASDFFGVHHDEDGDAAAAGAAADPQSPVAASLFEEGVRGGGANASSPERADDLQQRVSALQNELWATEARHEEDTKALRERIEHLETQTQGESDMNEEHFRDAQASVKRLEGELTQAKHETKAVQEELLQAAAKIEQLQNVEASVADLQQEVERLRDAEYSVQRLGKDLEELSQERQALQDELNRLRDAESSSQRLEKDLEEALQERQALQEELDRLRDAESTTQRLEKELEEVSQERQELRQTIDKLSEEQRTAQEDASVGLQVAQDQISSLNSEVATLQTERDGLSAEVTQLRRESDARRQAETRASDLNAALENARAQSDGLQADLTEARDALDATKSELASVCAALEEARSSLSSGLADSQSKLAATEAALLETKGELATVTATRDELQASVDELHASLGEVQGRVEELKEELETTKASLFDVEVAKAEAEKALASEQKMGREAVFKAEHAGREALEAEHASKLELEKKLAAAEVARSENESQRAALADQVERLEEAKLEWEHEKRTLASDAQEKVSHFEAHIAELQRNLKLSMEMCADLEEKVQETQEVERIRDEIEARDRALVRLSQRTTKLLGLVKRLEQERDRAQEDAAAMYDLRINDELEERGGGLRTRTQSPLRSAASGRTGRVKEVFGSPGVLKASKSLGVEVDEEETENSRSENPASAAEALLHRSGSISSSSACADRADDENAVGGEWDAMYDQLDERLNEYLEKNQSQEARDTALEQGLAEAMQGLAECSDLADVALARREASRDAALEIETLGEKLRIAEQETVSLQARFESSQQQLQYAKEELELARPPVSNPEDINARADEVAGLHEEIGALREEIQRLQGLLTATRMEGDAHEEGDRQTSASQDEVAHLQEEQLRLRNELALAHEQLRAAKAEAREQEEANAELLRTQLKEGSTQTPLASGSTGSAAIAAAAAADEVQALDEREVGAGWSSENEGEEGDANPISDAEVNDGRLAEALERAAEAEDAVRALEARCAAAESKCKEFSKEPELLKALSAELSDCMALSAQLRPGTAIEESETKDEVDPALEEALRERDEALQRVARLEKQLAMRKSIFGAKSGLVGQSNSVEDRPLSPPTSDLPLSASPMQSPNRVIGADLSEASRPARSLTIPSKRAQQVLNEPFGAARSTGEATLADKMPSSANDGHVGPNVPDSPLVMPWSEKWWDDEPEDLDLDSPDPDALGSSEPPSAVSSGPAFSTVPSPGDSAAAVGAVGLTSPPTSSSMMTSPPLNPPHSAFGSAPDSSHENAREARSNSVRFGDLPAQEWRSVAATSADTPAASGVVPPTSAQESVAGERTGAATLQEQETEQGDGKKRSKRKVTEPRFLSQMFGLGKHRDLVEASMQDDNSDFDEGEMNEARPHAGGHDSSSVSEGNDMSDPFKAAREIRSRSRTFSNLSSRSLARDAYGHGNYPTFEVRQEPTGIIAGQEAEALSLQQQQQHAQAQAQQPLSSHRASPPMDPVKPMANPQSEGREPGLSTTSEDSIFGMSRSPDQGMLPPSQASPPPLYPVDAASGWSSPPTGVAEDDLMQDGNAETEWANMLHGTESNGEDAEGVSASSPRVSMDASAGIISEEQIASLLAAKAELEGKLVALEHELGTEREARMWRERQVCLAESELEKALVEVEELRAQLEAAAAAATAAAPSGYANDSGALPVLPAVDAADRDGESRSENSNPVRMRLSIDTGRGPATQDASGAPPFADPGPPPPPMAASLPPASGGHNTTSMPMPPPPMDVRSEQESMALRTELVQCKQELERAQAEILRLQSELNSAGEGVGPGLQRLKELLTLREKDFDYVTKNLALDVYARSKESPSSIQNGAVAPPSTPRRKAPLHAEQGHATVVYTNSSRVRRVAVWVHNFLLPHVLLVLTTFLVSAGMPPDVMKEVLRLASNVPT